MMKSFIFYNYVQRFRSVSTDITALPGPHCRRLSAEQYRRETTPHRPVNATISLAMLYVTYN